MEQRIRIVVGVGATRTATRTTGTKVMLPKLQRQYPIGRNRSWHVLHHLRHHRHPCLLPNQSHLFPGPHTATHNSSLDTDLTQEKLASLSLLKSLFGTQNDDDWIGRESVGSDIDDAELERLKREGGRGNIRARIDGVADVEEVPMDLDRAQQTVDTGRQGEDEDEEMEVVGVQEPVEQEPVIDQQLKAPVQMTELKDLFAPREEDGSFRSVPSFLSVTLQESTDNCIFSRILPP
jgi:hypothetical protein